jgi:flavin-dependent dehydrogenase
MWPINTLQQGNIRRVIPVDLLNDGDYEDELGFFIRVGTYGYLTYYPLDNDVAITKYFEASSNFIDPEICRKIVNMGVVSPAQASDVYVGYGI